MGLLWSVALSIQFLLLSSFFSSKLTNCSPSIHHPTHECHEDESYALLHFKESFVISKYASLNPFSYPKTVSWMSSTDCCSWDGIECDDFTGHVIGIDLSSSQLYGSMDANSSLFSLVHLQRLDLSDNDFNHSQIPFGIGKLSKIMHLNLSHISETTFSGEVPPEVSNLSNLLHLDLSSYTQLVVPPYPIKKLRLNISTLRNFIQNSTRLEVLRLDYVNISSFLPATLTNLTHLQQLSLTQCELYGEFPIDMFLKLKMLTLLHLSQNKLSLLTGRSSFNATFPPPLQVLGLRSCNLSGEIPSWIMNLTNLAYLDLSYNKLQGEIPHSIFGLVNLKTLYLHFNLLQGRLELEKFLRLKMLTALKLSYNKLSLFTGKSSPNVTLPPIQKLGLNQCNLSGEIPSWIMNLTTLSYLSLQQNYLQGEIPCSVSNLDNLETLSFSSNLLEGQLEFDMFLKLKRLTWLGLSWNKLSLREGKSSSNATISRIQMLDVSSCNLVEFPNFLQHLDELIGLYIWNNDLKSPLPSWMWRKRRLLGLHASNSSLIGEISRSICNLKSLEVLDLSYNNLSGTIPSCLGSFSKSLQSLILHGNNLVGHIPQAYMIGSVLKMIDLRDNNLVGQLPRALVNCRVLEYLDVTHNQINDSFPYWLGSLPELKVIGLRQNQFYGAIKCPRKCIFPKLHIIDLSQNNFSGNLNSDTFKNWKSMTTPNMSQLQYEAWDFYYGRNDWFDHVSYSFTISNKGVAMDYEGLQQSYFMMIAIDLSSNRISGEIPDVLGDLKSLVLLNLSNNMLSGNIPSSLGKLSNLETLDLSLNSLSGKIPQQLTELTFLEFCNVSFNNLSGAIPEDKQFSTFEGNSFQGNQGLCGIQLAKKCEDHGRSSLPEFRGDQGSDSKSFFEFDWKIILIGYGGGLVAGLALGNTFSSDIIRWLKRIF